MNIFVNNMVMLDEFTRELEFFRTNPVIRYDVMKHYVAVHFTMIRNLFKNKQSPEVQENFFEALENPALNQHGKNLVAAYLFSERALNK